MIKKTILCILCISCCLPLLYAQKQTAANASASKEKFKPPKLTTTLGTYSDSVTMPLVMAESLIAARLKITDAANTEYTVSSYQFLYRKKTVTEDEQTGKVSPSSSIVSDLFRTSPLPAIWIEKIREQLKSGEELFFFDVIVKDKNGRVMYAPNLKIIIQ